MAVDVTAAHPAHPVGAAFAGIAAEIIAADLVRMSAAGIAIEHHRPAKLVAAGIANFALVVRIEGEFRAVLAVDLASALLARSTNAAFFGRAATGGAANLLWVGAAGIAVEHQRPGKLITIRVADLAFVVQVVGAGGMVVVVDRAQTFPTRSEETALAWIAADAVAAPFLPGRPAGSVFVDRRPVEAIVLRFADLTGVLDIDHIRWDGLIADLAVAPRASAVFTAVSFLATLAQATDLAVVVTTRRVVVDRRPVIRVAI